jgi:plastocyanin
MKGLLALIVAIIVIGGGYYWYTTQQTPAATDDTSAMNDMNNMDSTAGTQPDTTADTASSSTPGTGVTVGASAGVSTGTVKEFTITAKNFSFAPATMSVKKGDTVKITFVNSQGFHDLRVDGYNVGTKQLNGGAQETITFVADKAGTFEYYCSVGNHRAMGMKGTLTVQ